MQLIPRETLYIRVLVWLAKPVPYGRAMVVYRLPPEFERSELGNSSRVPRYQKGRRISGLCNSSVKSSHIGEDLDGVDVFLLLFLRQKKKEYPAGQRPVKLKMNFKIYYYEMVNC